MPQPQINFLYVTTLGTLEVFNEFITADGNKVEFSLPQKFLIVSDVVDLATNIVYTSKVLSVLEQQLKHDISLLKLVQIKNYRLENEIFNFSLD